MTSGTGEKVVGIILAAGKGTRMKSDLPKVLHPVAGKPMVEHVIGALAAAGIDQACLVLGPNTQPFDGLLEAHKTLPVCIQGKQLGTGDAVASASSLIAGAKVPAYTSGSLFRGRPLEADYVVICAGDTPALDPEILRAFISDGIKQSVSMSVLAMDVPQPHGYGRIVCDDAGRFLRIVEEKDATDVQRRITVCNSGVILARAKLLFELLAELAPNNSQGEYYLTDTLGLAVARQSDRAANSDSHMRVTVFVTGNWQGFSGINDRAQLAAVEAYMQAQRQMAKGERIAPASKIGG